jgi:hypothetical protein
MTDRDALKDHFPYEDELRPARGIAWGCLLSLPLWAIIYAIFALRGADTLSGDPCVCAEKPADSDCQNVRIDIGEGRFATGVTWINDSGKPRSCLRIPPKT